MPEIGIRSVEFEDLEALKQIEHDYQTNHVWQMERSFEPGNYSLRFQEVRLPRSTRVEHPSLVRWNSEEDLKQLKGLVAILQNAPVGYIFLETHQDTFSAWVTDLTVKKRYRRQGIASTLMFAAQEWAAKNKYKRIILQMQSKNYPAIRFAQKLGFEFCGYNDHYYANQDIALFFARYLR